MNTIAKAHETVEVLICETAKLPGKSLPDGLHMRCTCHGESESALGTHGEPLVLIVRQCAINMTLLIGEWRKHEAILHGRAMRERDGIEQRHHGFRAIP